VCTQLGFPGAKFFSQQSYFGPVSEDFSFNNIKCSGIEDNIGECKQSGNNKCLQSDGAGVVCIESNKTQSGMHGGGAAHAGLKKSYCFLINLI